MSRARALVIGLLVLSGSATTARAQGPGIAPCSRFFCFAVSGGLTVPAADMADFHDSGFHYDASVFLNIPGLPISFRPEFSLTQFQLKEPVTNGGEITDVTKMFSAIGNIELGLGGGLYVLAGGGVLSMNTADLVGAEDSETKFTFDAGAGYRFKMGGIRGFLEARVGAASYDQGMFAFEQAKFIPFTFGLIF